MMTIMSAIGGLVPRKFEAEFQKSLLHKVRVMQTDYTEKAAGEVLAIKKNYCLIESPCLASLSFPQLSVKLSK